MKRRLSEDLMMACGIREMFTGAWNVDGDEIHFIFGEVPGTHGPMIVVSNLVGSPNFKRYFIIDARDGEVMTPGFAKLSSTLTERISHWVIENSAPLSDIWARGSRSGLGEDVTVEDLVRQLSLVA